MFPIFTSVNIIATVLQLRELCSLLAYRATQAPFLGAFRKIAERDY